MAAVMGLGAGLAAVRETCALQPRADPRARGSRQRVWGVRGVQGHKGHHAIH